MGAGKTEVGKTGVGEMGIPQFVYGGNNYVTSYRDIRMRNDSMQCFCVPSRMLKCLKTFTVPYRPNKVGLF